jgi:hypothetical protein
VFDDNEYIDWLKGRVQLPTDHVLEGLGFRRNELGNYARQWGRAKMIAPEWLGGYHFSCVWVSADRRTIGCPEFRVPRNVAPAILLAALYDHCGGGPFNGNLPLEFQIGKEELKFQHNLLSLRRLPTIWVERTFFRFCISYLQRKRDWVEADYSVRLDIVGSQLRIACKDQTVFCPIRGEWLGASTVSARNLFVRLPKRFSKSVVVLAQEGKVLRIDGYSIPAEWEETK